MTDRLREVALWTGALLGLLSVVAGTAVMFFGYTFLIFRSGSMGPDIPTGSVALARTTPVAELEPGDVVSVVAANGARVTHRLVSATVRGDEGSLILQGDTNATPDAEIYQVSEAERSIASVPYLGYVVTVLLSPAGLVAAGCLSGMVLLLGFGSSDDRSGDKPTRRGNGSGSSGGKHRGDRVRDSRRNLVSAGVGVAMVAGVVAAGGVAGTSAYFTDRPTLASGTFAAGSVTPAGNVRCVNNASQDYVTWSAPSGAAPLGYRVFWSASNGDSGQADFTTIQQYQPPVVAFFGVTYNVTVVAVRGSWTSAVSNAASIRGFTFFGTTWSC